jgi:predicted 3-demethylubiquinone-9 3-methyltransferase (glyoxalase superfamily)
MANVQKIAPCLWFDKQAEEAAKFYVSVFKGSKIIRTSHYSEAGQETHGQLPGTVMTVEFELVGQRYTALNGGPAFKFNEAVSLQVYCDTQDEIDTLWQQLSEGGDKRSQQCGWLKDKYGLSWQIVPTVLAELIDDQKSPASKRALEAMLEMKKLDIAAIKRAYAG